MKVLGINGVVWPTGRPIVSTDPLQSELMDYPMELPTINIGGTNRGDLLTDYIRAKQALQKAIEAVGAVYPHGRDYPSYAGFSSLAGAQREHTDRLVKLRQVLAEIETLAEHVA